jgi:putative oxidoreductase
MTSLHTDNRLIGGIHSLTRLVVGGLFACHGAAGIFGILGGAPGYHGHAAPFAIWPSWWASLIELVAGVLIAVGLFTRVASVLASGTMAYAYFTVHLPHALLPIENGGEPAALYSWAFLLFAVVGAGPIAVDTLLRSRRGEPSTEGAAPSLVGETA